MRFRKTEDPVSKDLIVGDVVRITILEDGRSETIHGRIHGLSPNFVKVSFSRAPTILIDPNDGRGTVVVPRESIEWVRERPWEGGW